MRGEDGGGAERRAGAGAPDRAQQQADAELTTDVDEFRSGKDAIAEIGFGHGAQSDVGAAAGDAREVRGAQADLVHARLEARGNVAGPGGVRRHGQAAHGGLHAGATEGTGVMGGLAFVFMAAVWNGRLVIETQAGGFLGGGFDLAEHGADDITLVQLGGKADHAAGAGRGDGHGGLVGLDFDQVLVGHDVVAGLDEVADDGRLGDGLAELGHDDGDLRHKITFFYHKGTKTQRGKAQRES